MGVSAWGEMSRDVHRGTACARSATPSGTTNPPATAALARWEPHGTLNPHVLLGEGSRRAQQGAESPGHSSRGSGHSPPSLTPPALPRTTQRHLLPRPNRLAAEAASLTSDPHYTQPNHFLAQGPFRSWVIRCSWSSIPTRQQHQLRLLISSGCNPGWNQVRGSCRYWWRKLLELAGLVLQLPVWSTGAAGDLCSKTESGTRPEPPGCSRSECLSSLLLSGLQWPLAGACAVATAGRGWPPGPA